MTKLRFKSTSLRRGAWYSVVLVAVVGFTVGCPDGSLPAYDLGFDDGFAEDAWYFEGYDDSFLTVGAQILYEGGDIPLLEDGSYDAGYYDGIWYAYNDGYFVAYQDAFIVGFSEGYDAMFYADWPDVLAGDVHIEFDNGGFDDAYNDGFSEGRVFGAFDYDTDLPFDWEDAFLDWQAGTDVAVIVTGGAEVSTGVDGPVLLYEYGFDPSFAKARTLRNGPLWRSHTGMRTVVNEKGVDGEIVPRAWTDDQLDRLEVTPNDSPRSDKSVRLSTTWLDRILAVTGDPQEVTTKRTSGVTIH